MIETTTSDAVLTRQMQAQAERLGRLDALEAKVADLEAENARLTATLATPAATVPQPVPVKTGRRRMLRRVLGASAAAALLLVAKEATTAEAAARGTIIAMSASTVNYGILATTDVGDPAVTFGNVIAAGSVHGVIGATANPDINPPSGSGVLGQGAGNYGVIGLSLTGRGVYGESRDTAGVQGVSTNNAGVFAQGPIGLFATGTGVAGVFGGSNGNGFGFWGNSATSAGVYGTSTNGPGVRAESTNSFGLHAKSPTWAGVFEGNVFVTGRVVALGGVGASATATSRMLAEDVGEATLVNGKATVTLAQDFADEIKGGQYQVFVTPHDASGRGLAVVARRRDGFDVQELAGGTTETGDAPGRGSNAGFSYRVVAKLAGPRQAPLAPPDLTTIKPAPPLPEPPKAPEPGPSPDRRER